MRKVISLISLSFLTSVLYAQEGNFCKDFCQDLEIAVSYGAVIFNGDIKQYEYTPAEQMLDDGETFNALRYAFTLALRKKITERITLDFAISSGQMAGLKRYIGDDAWGRNVFDPYKNFDGNGEKFENEFRELSFSLIFPIKELNEYTGEFNFSARIGSGLSIFRTYKSDLYTNEYIYSYGYKDDVNGIGKDSWSQAPNEAILIFGVLAEYATGNDINLTLDFTYKYGMSDIWDASIATSRNDSYYYLGLGVSRQF